MKYACWKEARKGSGKVLKILKDIIGDLELPKPHVWKELVGLPSCFGCVHHLLANRCNKYINNRRRACTLYKNEDAVEWGKLAEKEFLSRDDIEIEEGTGLANIVRGVGERLLKASPPRCYKRPMKFLVYDRPGVEDINAIALPSGTVLVSKDLVRKVDESELAAVLGHEIAHIEFGSFDAALIVLFAENSTLSKKLRNLKDVIFSVCRGPMDEVFVDLKGVKMAEAAGYDPMGAARIHKRLLFDSRKPGALRIYDSHPPSTMRATMSAYRAQLLAINPEDGWKHHVYFRGDVDQTKGWDGKVPQRMNQRCYDESTQCGDSGLAPDDVAEEDWVDYRCMSRSKSSDGASCRSWREYASSSELGCPDRLVCCPP